MKNFHEKENKNNCWIISDNTKGMLNQSIALANALNIKTEHILAIPTPLLRLFPTLAKIPGWQLTLGKKPNWLKLGYFPSIIITCGKRMAGISIGIKRLSNGFTKTIHIQDPNVDSSNFDLLIVPEHDYFFKQKKSLFKDNVIFTKGSLNYLTNKIINESYIKISNQFLSLKKPIIAILIGGNNKRYKLKNYDYEIFSNKLVGLSKKTGISFAIIPSRRTTKKGLRIIKEKFEKDLDKNKFLIYEQSKLNLYPGILKIAKSIIVTTDSINMQTEVCITRKPIFLYEMRSETGKIDFFKKFLIKEGYAKTFEELEKNPKLISTKFKQLNEIKNIAKTVKSMLNI